MTYHHDPKDDAAIAPFVNASATKRRMGYNPNNNGNRRTKRKASSTGYRAYLITKKAA